MRQSLGDIVLVEGNNKLDVQMVPTGAPPTTATLYGAVSDAETGKGISGVFVRVIHEIAFMLADVWTTTTDNNGFYLIEGIGSDITVYVAFGKGFYQKVEITNFQVRVGANELNVSMVYTGPAERSEFLRADIPKQVVSGAEFWAGQTMWLVDYENLWPTHPQLVYGGVWYEVSLVGAGMVLETARFYTPKLWDRHLKLGTPRTGIRMNGTGEYPHYGIDITKSYGAPAKAVDTLGIVSVYSSCRIYVRWWYDSRPGSSSPGYDWQDIPVGTVEVI